MTTELKDLLSDMDGISGLAQIGNYRIIADPEKDIMLNCQQLVDGQWVDVYLDDILDNETENGLFRCGMMLMEG